MKGQLGTGRGAQGHPSHRCYVKPAALPSAKGSPASHRLGLALPGCQGRGSGARQGWTNGAGKSAGPGDSSLAGEGSQAAERGTPWHTAQSCLCVSPGPPRPAGKRHRVAFWGRLAAGQGPLPPTAALGGWGPPWLARWAPRWVLIQLRDGATWPKAKTGRDAAWSPTPGGCCCPITPGPGVPTGSAEDVPTFVLPGDWWPQRPGKSSHGTAGAGTCQGQQPPQHVGRGCHDRARAWAPAPPGF